MLSNFKNRFKAKFFLSFFAFKHKQNFCFCLKYKKPICRLCKHVQEAHANFWFKFYITLGEYLFHNHHQQMHQLQDQSTTNLKLCTKVTDSMTRYKAKSNQLNNIEENICKEEFEIKRELVMRKNNYITEVLRYISECVFVDGRGCAFVAFFGNM